jgi:hypothetical protein
LALVLLIALLPGCKKGQKMKAGINTYSGLPQGITLNSQGVLSGTPSGPPGIYTFTVAVTDATNQTASSVLSMNIYQKGDINQDFQVNVQDLIIVGQAFGQTGTPGSLQADTNGDGVVDVRDLIIVGQHIGM